MKRIILSVLAGFVLWSVLWLGANAVSVALVPDAYNEDGTSDSAAVLIVFLILSVACSVGSGFLTAALARTGSLAPAWALGGLLLAFGAVVQILSWEAAPLWFHLPFLALLVPAVLAGAKLGPRSTGES